MKERIEKLIDALAKQREGLLGGYFKVLESYDAYDGGQAADDAGKIHDIDWHITNLHLELKRIEGVARG